MYQKAEAFARSHNLPILRPNSEFPQYFASHRLGPDFDITSERLLSSEELDYTGLTTGIDVLLGTTGNVFFALGKGYLTTYDSVGLIYDPLVLLQSPGVFLVENDLMYILDQTQILQQFCISHRGEIDMLLPAKDQAILWSAVENNESLLLADSANSAAHIFDRVLPNFTPALSDSLKTLLQKEIVLPNKVTSDLAAKIDSLFTTQHKFLNTFSDEHTEERVIELQVPRSYPVQKGLIGVFIS